MTWRFRRSFKLLPGVRINLGKRGVSASVGPRGAKVTIGRGQVRTTVGVPGTGVSKTTSRRLRPEPRSGARELAEQVPGRRYSLWWWVAAIVAVPVLVGMCADARADPIQPGQYRVGMSKGEAKAVGYANCRFERENDEKSAVLCDGEPAKVTLPGLKTTAVRLSFAPPRHDRLTAVRVEVAESAGAAAKALQPGYGALYRSGKRRYVFVGDHDVTATLTEPLAGRPHVDYTVERGATERYRKHAAELAGKEGAAAAKLKSF